MQTIVKRGVLCFLTFVWPAVALGLPPKVVEQTKKVTALVEVSIGDDRGFGTAFCIDAKGIFVTNAHVVAMHKGQAGTYNLILSPGESDQRVVHAKVLRKNVDFDLALIQIETPGTLIPVHLGDVSTLYDTMELTAFGFPFGGALALKAHEYPSISVSTGHVTSLRKKDGALEVIQLDAVLNPGNSGGPVVDANGNVVGIVRSGLPGAGINFAIPVSRLKKFLEGGFAPDPEVAAAPAPSAEPPTTGRPRPAIAPAPSPAPAPPGIDTTGGKTWELTSYLKGTAPKVREQLNGEVERLIKKINDTEVEIKTGEKDCEADEKAAIDKLHQSAVYKKTLAESTQAQADLETARKSGTASDRVTASSRYNKARFALESMEHDAVENSKPLLEDQRHVYESKHELKRFRDSYAKANVWRDHLLEAIRQTYQLRAPVAVNSAGVFPDVTVLEVLSPDQVLVRYRAPELLGKRTNAEGIDIYDAHFTRVKILLVGINTARMKPKDEISIDHTFRIEKINNADGDNIYVATPAPTENDGLLAMIVPLREKLKTPITAPAKSE